MSDQHEFIRSSAVRKRYGGVSAMWLDRKLRDPRSSFPKPTYFGRERYWRVSDLIAWEQRCATNLPKIRTPPPAPPTTTKVPGPITGASSTSVEPTKQKATSNDKRGSGK